MTVYSELSTADDFEIKRKRKKRFLNVADSLIALFVVTPLVVGAFRGTWNLVEFRYREYFPYWQTLCTAIGVLLIFTYLRRTFMDVVIEKHKYEKSFRKTAVRVFLVRIYHYIFAVCSISYWLHMWDIIPRAIGKTILIIFWEFPLPFELVAI